MAPVIEAPESPVQPLVAPELPTVQTDYDLFKARRAKLIAALRSGKHTQIRSALRTSVGFCLVGLGDYLIDHED